VQGRLRESDLSVEIESKCAHSGRTIRLSVGSDLSCRIEEGEPTLLVFEPGVDWSRFAEPDIIHSY